MPVYIPYHFGDDSDWIYADVTNDEVFAGYGNDVVRGFSGSDYLHGEQNDDTLYGGAGDDILDGGSGDDDIEGGEGADRMIGGQGDDHFIIYTSAEGRGDFVSGGLGIDRLEIGFDAPNQAVNFAATDPSLRTSFMGILTFEGIERYTIDGDDFGDSIAGYRLDDILTGWGGNDTLRGMDGDDSLWGEEGRDQLDGGGGADALHGGADADKVLGGSGDDSLWGDAGDDYIDGGTGMNLLYGGSGKDALYGGVGADQIYTYSYADVGAVEADRVVAGAGNDSVTMGITDIADGGAGIDLIQLTFGNSTRGETFTMSDGKIALADGGWFSKFEQLLFEGGSGRDVVKGGAFNDTVHGGLGDDVLGGGQGADLIYGDAGNDTIHGDEGADYLVESDGTDRIYGDAGDDLITVGKTTGGGNVIDGGEGLDKVSLGEIFDSMSAYVDLANQARNAGYARNTTFSGIEVFEGSGRDDTFLGSTGNDTFIGGKGGDVLNGRDGDDVLVGGGGADLLVGGRGNDIFSFAESSTFFPYDWRGDQISDFRTGEDKLLIEGDKMGFPGGVGFRLVSGAGPVATVAAPTLLFDSDTHQLWWDEDGKGLDHDAVLVATLDNVTRLTVADFLIV